MGIDKAVARVVRTAAGLSDLASWVSRANRRRASSLRCLEGWYPREMTRLITALESGQKDTNTLYGAARLVRDGDEALRVRLPEVVDPTPELRGALERIRLLRHLVNEASEVAI